jgi:hypothetical protein
MRGRALFTLLAMVVLTSVAAPPPIALAVTPPDAYDDYAYAVAGEPLVITLQGFDADEEPLAFDIASPPAGGTLGPVGSPTCEFGSCTAEVTYTAAAGSGSTDSFTFTVDDGTATSEPATVAIEITQPPCPGAIISNGTVQLGVHCTGNLNVDGGTPSSGEGTTIVGLRYVPTNADSTSPGCTCEGWGAADAATGVRGYANDSSGSHNVSVLDFTSTASTATSRVAIGSTFEVTHSYRPSAATPNLYEVAVEVKNVSPDPVQLRYRRVMDWDIEPTAFNEYSTIDTGTATEIVFSSNDGFAGSDPLGLPSDLGSTGNFVDAGPADHGALFDFDFGALASGATKSFTTFYGAAGTETGAAAALAAVGAEAYSLGQPSTEDGPTLGTPNTFVFAFDRVGGEPVFTPDAVDDTLSTAEDTAGTRNVLANDTDPNGDAIQRSSSTSSEKRSSDTL